MFPLKYKTGKNIEIYEILHKYNISVIYIQWASVASVVIINKLSFNFGHVKLKKKSLDSA